MLLAELDYLGSVNISVQNSIKDDLCALISFASISSRRRKISAAPPIVDPMSSESNALQVL